RPCGSTTDRSRRAESPRRTISTIAPATSDAGCTRCWGRKWHDAARRDRGGLGPAREHRRERHGGGGGGRRGDPGARYGRGAGGGEGRWRLDRQPVAEEGGAAVLPPEPDGIDLRRTRRRGLVGQGSLQVPRLDPGRFRGGGLPRRPRCDRTARRLYRQ